MSVIQRQIRVGWQLRVFFTENVFALGNLTLKNALAVAEPRKVLVVIENSLEQARPEIELVAQGAAPQNPAIQHYA